ncbi:MAG TPA: ABC transporter permease subunit [Armatimonadota bacterium]|jgi:ABC-type transport system involved in multi-copper enzyme maturation permease subunit
MNTWVIARSTFGEAIRKKIGMYILFTSLIFIVLSQLFASLSMSGSVAQQTASSGSLEVQIITSMAFGIMVIGGLILAIFLSFDLIPSDCEKKTIYTILSKPVWRWQYVLGKFVGTVMALAVNIAFMGLALMVVVFAKTMQIQWPILAGVFFTFLQFVLLAGISIMLSLLVTRNINVAMCFGFYILGTVNEFWQDIAKAAPSPVIHWIANFLHVAIPSFYSFNFVNIIVHPELWKETPTLAHDAAASVLYGILWTSGVLVIAVAVFSRKEV